MSDIRKYKVKRKKVKGQGMSTVEKTVTGYGADKVKTKTVDGVVVKRKTGTLISRAQEAAKKFYERRKETQDAKAAAAKSGAKANQARSEEIKAKKEKKLNKRLSPAQHAMLKAKKNKSGE